MKRVTRLLFLTVFVIPILTISNVSAFGGPGGRAPIGQRDFQGHRDPFNNHVGDISPSAIGNEPIDHIDPYGGNDYHNRILDRDPFVQGSGGGWGDPAGSGNSGTGNSGNGGGTAPLDGGISLLLAAGIGLGMKKARAARRANQQKSIDISGDIS
jgi:hypothetical protein